MLTSQMLELDSMDATGSFMSPPGRATTPSLGAPIWIPYGIAFTTAGGIQYAYVVNNQSVNINSIYRCPVDEPRAP